MDQKSKWITEHPDTYKFTVNGMEKSADGEYMLRSDVMSVLWGLRLSRQLYRLKWLGESRGVDPIHEINKLLDEYKGKEGDKTVYEQQVTG